MRVLDLAKHAGLTVATVESCTGGMVAAALTAIPGSSAVLERGWVTYANQAKHDEVGVPWDVLTVHGAVSPQTAMAMAEGALTHSPVDVAIAITGIAGPDGGTNAKPVGLVHFACARRHRATRHEQHIFSGDRAAIRAQAAAAALTLLAETLL